MRMVGRDEALALSFASGVLLAGGAACFTVVVEPGRAGRTTTVFFTTRLTTFLVGRRSSTMRSV